ncbi:TetR/AcrR family transcriptional regulator [Dyadobacter psychrotolerans]|uniref:TetR/AcrR family transcriptional regulator n=1 Tax=Dyadobacter psychrotolerans TaxID=2541721 RepID=A0A4V2Z2Y2_9BACT|nr:TetR family transcriptional regulator [Dyadobacter psychrotolerans]TDE10498.1 TetR/AcrR family transcriptional regulator [Dyadobacter psychrotolerans]
MEYNPKQLQIIAVAERLFAAKGFSGTSIRDISQEADINVSMISYYFGSKEKLIEALFTVRAVEFRKRLEDLLMNVDLSPFQQVNLMIDGIIDRLIEKQCFHNIVAREQLMTDSRTPIISALLRDLKVNNLRAMENIIHNGQKLGVFRPDVDVLMLSTALFGTINQALSTKPFYRIINDMQDVTEDYLEEDIRKRLSIHLKKLFRDTLQKELNLPADS